jgi:hypothetical protein
MSVAMRWLSPACIVFVIGCGGSAVHFTEGPVIRAVDDRADIERPVETEFERLHHHFTNFFERRARNGLDPMPPPPALDVNRLGEVPNSSWFVNRSESLSAEDVFRGAGGHRDSPESHLPWTLTRVKVGGRNPGFLFRDASGERFLLKVDKVGTPTIATAAGAVANRLFWALGYKVPDDRVVFFRREDLLLGEDAREAGISDELVTEVLEGYATRLADGRWRALVSRFLPGRPVGGFSYRGTRPDDPNDRIAHERRRSLRALRVFGAWLNHVDAKIDNTLDLYTEQDGRRFVEHYLVDFDGCLGGYWAARHEKRIGWAYDLDLGQMFSAIGKLGLDHRAYEELTAAVHPEIGLFEADTYDPSHWRANYVNDQILSATPADLYWAGQKLSLLGAAHIESAVATARFSDPEAAPLLSQILLDRWQKTTRWALTRVSPVERLDAQPTSGGGFNVDTADALELAGLSSRLRYQIRILDAGGRPLLGFLQVDEGPAVEVGPKTLGEESYVIVEWTAIDEEGRRLPPTMAHYARRDSWKLVGVLRDGQ